jgi:type VI secretion system secreted protein Hcp
MAADQFLKLGGGLDGESVDAANPGHANEIEIVGWSLGATNPATFVGPGGGQQSKPVVTEIHVTKVCDKASVKLWKALLGGQHIPDGKITCRKAIKDSDKLEYLTIELTDVQVTGIQWSGSGQDTFLHETVSLVCAVFEHKYTPQKDDGTKDGPITVKYDMQKQTVV